MRAMVVDDSQTVRQLVISVATRMGIECIDADEAEKGYRKLQRSKRVKLLLVDWEMAGANNMRWLRDVRQWPQFNGVRLIVMITKSDLPLMDAAKAAGADGFVLKPMSEAFLREALTPLVAKATTASAA